MKDYPYDARGITLNETPESMEGALVKHPSRKPSHEQGTILFFEVDDVDDVVDHVHQEHIPVWREPFPIGHSPEREPCMGRICCSRWRPSNLSGNRCRWGRNRPSQTVPRDRHSSAFRVVDRLQPE